MFGKKKKESNDTEKKTAQPEQPVVSRRVTENIQVMPKQFRAHGSSEGKKSKKWLFIIIGGLFILIIVSAVIAYYLMKAEVPTAFEGNSDGQLVTSDGGEVPVETPTPTPTQSPTPSPSADLSPSPSATTEPAPEPSESPTPEPSVEPTPPNVAITGSVDGDSDGLTDNEEKIYGTFPNRADSDNDSFLDGEEVINGFSPGRAGQTLIESRLVQMFTENIHGFQMLYPVRWLQTASGSTNDRTIIFDSKIGETVTVRVLENNETQKIDLRDLALEDSPDLSAIDFVNSPINNFVGVKTKDGLKYYLEPADSAYFLIITYTPTSEETHNFDTTFLMMIGSINQF